MESSNRPTGCGIALLSLVTILFVAGVIAAIVTQRVAPPAASLVKREGPPDPVLKIKPPEAPPSSAEGQDLRAADGDDLLDVAERLMADQRWADALPYQYWGVEATGRGRGELALCYAQSGQQDAALYWLQEAAIHDGVAVESVQSDPLWQPLRDHKSWKSLEAFLEACRQHWHKSIITDIVSIEPQGRDVAGSLPAIVVLPPNGQCPSRFVRRSRWQPVADRFGMVVIGVSGVGPEGPHRFVWGTDETRNHNHIRNQLDGGLSGPKYQLGKLIAIGFGEGGPLAFEVTARYPNFFQGSIVVSPRKSSTRFETIEREKLHLQSGFVLVTDPNDVDEARELTQRYADWAKTVGAHVMHEELPVKPAAVPSTELIGRVPAWIEWLQAVSAGKSTRTEPAP